MKDAPETLAARAVNQYRKRDIVGFLGARIYLDSNCSRRDVWATDVAAALSRRESKPVYHTSYHFKERDEDSGEIHYRRIHVPSPNEILAEAALLGACAESGAFSTPPSVYSYELASGDDRRGVFVPYFDGFRQRHVAIARAARSHQNGIVVYTDIRRFYPSISDDVARKTWHDAAKSGRLAGWAESLGQRLLENHSGVEDSGAHGVLTGPMFSHVVGNLVLRDIDSEMCQILPDGYFRYVDDFALVGERQAVLDAEKYLNELLDAIGLSINNDKRLEVSTREWLVGAGDFSNEQYPVSWMTFVGGMKQLLITKPELAISLKHSLEGNGFRISPLNYSDAVKERKFMRRFYELHLKRWYKYILRNLNPHDLMLEALELRSRYESDFEIAIKAVESLEGFERKRRIHRLRFLCSRLIYLASPEKLRHIAVSLSPLPEMALYSAVFDALDRRDVSELVSYGVNAAHSVAQALLSSRPSLKCVRETWTVPARQARAVFVSHGFALEGNSPSDTNEMEQFCAWKGHSIAKPRPSSTYFGELILLHGIGVSRRHEELLTNAYDIDDEVVLDMGTLLEQSY